ncbi:restriction endonuclease subunit S [Aeromonas sp. Y318-3]|uniref:restriction endonuclease subunit S n=1 Tax=Aeromonas sp. Y318-3 TaxID=2990509 RepID=UPI0022E3234E|nr:restriction endonuclease subunit S [Aeromonas sp. Y318-3]
MKKGWKTYKLGELAELRGRIGWRGLTAKEYTYSGPLFLSVHSLNYGDYVDFRDAFHISDERYMESPEIMLKKDDILICKDGAGIGKLGLVGELSEKATINSSLLLIRSGDNILAKYLYHYLNSPYFQSIVQSKLNGATTPHLYQRDITEFPVFLPSILEQQRIVAILDEVFEAIVAARANAEQNRQNARALFESYLQSVFSQRGDGWINKPLSELCDIKHGFAFKSEYFTNEGDYTLLTPGNFFETGGYRDRGDKQKFYSGDIPQGFLLEAGDLLVAMTEQAAGLLGSPIIVPSQGKFLHNQRLGLVSGKPGIPWINEFFFHVFNTQAVRQAIHESASGAKVRHTSPTKIGAVTVAFPASIEEQKAIVATLDTLTIETQRLESLYQRKIAALDELKQSLLHQAFSGNL